MPRKARVVLPHTPHHIVQRGHNRQIVFADSGDFSYYLSLVGEFKDLHDLKLHAYCLMTNHVHLLVEPPNARALASFMKRVAGRMTRYRNRLEGRTGTLWESRYKSSPVQRDSYLLTCCRYIELNPVRAGMVQYPEDYPWSSFRQRMGEPSTLASLDLDPCYLELGDDDAQRRARYRRFLSLAGDAGAAGEASVLIREAVQRGQLTGNERFNDEVSGIVGRRVPRRGPGRPARR